MDKYEKGPQTTFQQRWWIKNQEDTTNEDESTTPIGHLCTKLRKSFKLHFNESGGTKIKKTYPMKIYPQRRLGTYAIN
jgi:hypothetical protein